MSSAYCAQISFFQSHQQTHRKARRHLAALQHQHQPAGSSASSAVSRSTIKPPAAKEAAIFVESNNDGNNPRRTSYYLGEIERLRSKLARHELLAQAAYAEAVTAQEKLADAQAEIKTGATEAEAMKSRLKMLEERLASSSETEAARLAAEMAQRKRFSSVLQEAKHELEKRESLIDRLSQQVKKLRAELIKFRHGSSETGNAQEDSPFVSEDSSRTPKSVRTRHFTESTKNFCASTEGLSKYSHASVKGAAVTTKDSCVSLEDAAVTTKDSQVSFEDAAVKTKDSQVSLEDAAVKTKDSQVSLEDAAVKTKDSQVSLEDAAVKTKDSRVSFEDAAVKTKDSQVSLEDAAVTMKYSQVSFEDAAVKTKDPQVSLEDAAVKTKDSQVSLEDAAVTTKDSQVSLEDAAVTMKYSQVSFEDAAVKTKYSRVLVKVVPTLAEERHVSPENFPAPINLDNRAGSIRADDSSFTLKTLPALTNHSYSKNVQSESSVSQLSSVNNVQSPKDCNIFSAESSYFSTANLKPNFDENLTSVDIPLPADHSIDTCYLLPKAAQKSHSPTSPQRPPAAMIENMFSVTDQLDMAYSFSLATNYPNSCAMEHSLVSSGYFDLPFNAENAHVSPQCTPDETDQPIDCSPIVVDNLLVSVEYSSASPAVCSPVRADGELIENSNAVNSIVANIIQSIVTQVCSTESSDNPLAPVEKPRPQRRCICLTELHQPPRLAELDSSNELVDCPSSVKLRIASLEKVVERLRQLGCKFACASAYSLRSRKTCIEDGSIRPRASWIEIEDLGSWSNPLRLALAKVNGVDWRQYGLSRKKGGGLGARIARLFECGFVANLSSDTIARAVVAVELSGHEFFN